MVWLTNHCGDGREVMAGAAPLAKKARRTGTPAPPSGTSGANEGSCMKELSNGLEPEELNLYWSVLDISSLDGR